jgi:serine/threonine protein kinase/Flp pilus assembly protein TadD
MMYSDPSFTRPANQPSRDVTSSPDLALPPEVRERFDAIEPFAQGSTGVLYLAREASTGRQGILKVLHERTGASEAERQRLRRELAKQATLSNPHLATPVFTGDAGRTIWLFREWIEGVTLRTRLDDAGALPAGHALGIATQLATALDELHRAGLLHRDLKPSHIVLQPREGAPPHVVVIDAGIAAKIETSSVFEVVGTPQYVSPEQASGKLVSFRSDLYALGCVWHEMLTGEPVFAADGVAALFEAHAKQEPPSPPSGLPPVLQELHRALLAKEPRERPFSAQQARRTLEPFAQDELAAESSSEGNVSDSNASNGTAPRRPSSTMLGMPAVTRPPSPPAPSQDVASVVSKPPPPPSVDMRPRASADSTDELDALDIEEVAPPVGSMPPPPPPEALATTVPAADLDYDDLAETTALEREAAAERLSAGSLFGSPAQSGTTPAAPDVVSSAAQHSAAQHSAAQHSAAQHSAAQHSAAQHSAAQQEVPGLGFGADNAPFAPPASQSAWEQAAPAPVRTSEDTDNVRATKKKRGVGMYILLGLLSVCVLTSVAGAAAAFMFGDRIEAELAALEELETLRPTAVGPTALPVIEPTEAAPFADPAAGELPMAAQAGTTADSNPVDAEANGEPEPVLPAAGQPEAQPAEPAPTAAELARVQRDAERAERAAARDAAREQARAEREQRAAARAEARTERAEARSPAGDTASGADASLRDQARDHFRARRYAEAEAAYERAAAMTPNDAGLFAGLGAARRAQGDLRGAVAAYQRALTLQPRNSGFWAALGAVYEGTGDRTNAVHAYQRALQGNPNNGAARTGLTRLGAQ